MDFKQIFESESVAASLGITLEQLRVGYAQLAFVVDAHHLNAAGVAQGGTIFTLADYAMAAVANAAGELSLSIQADIRFLASANLGDKLTARATEVFVRKSMSHYRVEVTNQRDELIAIAEGMFHRKADIKLTDLKPRE